MRCQLDDALHCCRALQHCYSFVSEESTLDRTTNWGVRQDMHVLHALAVQDATHKILIYAVPYVVTPGEAFTYILFSAV